MPKHINELNIKAYRGIHNLNLKDLGRINILVGKNNCGKTSVLEAIKIMENPEDFGSILRVASQRRAMNIENFFSVATSIFQDTGENCFIDILAMIGEVNTELNVTVENSSILSVNSKVNDEIEDNKVQSELIQSFEDDKSLEGKLQVYENEKSIGLIDFHINDFSRIPINEEKKRFKSLYVHSNVAYYTSCVKFIKESIINNTFNKTLLIAMIKIFDNDINDISIIGSEIYLHDASNNSKPFFSYGNGTQKAVLLAGVLSQCKDGIILIDEIDNAIHNSALNQIFYNFINVCKEMNIQAFITTHSLEALDVMLQVNEELSDDNMRVITLKQNKNEALARMLTGLEAVKARDEYNLELR